MLLSTKVIFWSFYTFIASGVLQEFNILNNSRVFMSVQAGSVHTDHFSGMTRYGIYFVGSI